MGLAGRRGRARHSVWQREGPELRCGMPETRKHKVVFLTQRGLRHQQRAIESAPPELDVAILREPLRTALLPLLGEAEFLISERAGAIDAEMIAAAPNLRLIQRLGVQTWDIDFSAARAAGVAVCSQPIQGCVMVAEHVLLQILGVLKRVREGMTITAEAADWGVTPHRTDEDHFAYNWSQRGGIGTLSGSAVGVLGFGEIGLELVMRLQGFDCQLLYNKRRRLPSYVEERYGLRFAAPDELAEQSDIVCSLLPYQGPKEPLDAAFFARMKTRRLPCSLRFGGSRRRRGLDRRPARQSPGRCRTGYVHVRAAAP